MERGEEWNDDTVSTYSEETILSSASDYRPHEKNRRRRGIRRKRSKYQNISNDLRATLIKLVTEENQKIKPTAKKLGINYSTAKSILQIYRKEGRTEKKLLFKPSGSEDETPAPPTPKNHILQKIQASQPEESCKSTAKSTPCNDHRYPLRRVPKIEDSDFEQAPRPSHKGIESKLAKKVKIEHEEPVGGRSPLSFDSEGLMRANSNEEGFHLHISQLSTRENSLRSPQNKTLELKRDEQLTQRQTDYKVNEQLYPGATSIKIPIVTYSLPTAGNAMNKFMMNQQLPQRPPVQQGNENLSFNMLNFGLSGLFNQQLQIQASRLLLMASQNPALRQQLFGQAVNTPTPRMMGGGYPMNFQMKM